MTSANNTILSVWVQNSMTSNLTTPIFARGWVLFARAKRQAREATDTLYSRNCFWLYHDDDNRILDWLKRIGSENRLCLRYLRIDYAYGNQKPLIPDLPTDEIRRCWPEPLEDDLDFCSSDVLSLSGEKSTLHAVQEVESVIQLLGQNYQLSRLELVLPYGYVRLVTKEDFDKDHIQWCHMHPDKILLVVLFCGFPQLLKDLIGINTLAIGPIGGLDGMESIARRIGVTKLMTFGWTGYVHLETEQQINQAKAKGWKIEVDLDESFRALKVLGN